ncbi:MAG: tetratricopeptide repeat protein, partial [Fibrobacterota bacterium]|nr:tetratricopeptide repeat protein [Fibrobacterota bacterium]
KAIGKFEELLQKFPASTYADNCNYWIGECHFAMGNFAKAIAGFRQVFTFPETEKADDAQLKLGYCQLRLGDKKLAAEEFKKVVSLYPDSEYTERAKEELAKLE